MSQGLKSSSEPSLFLYVDPDRLQAHIPKRHFYVQLDALLDLSFVRDLTAPLYAAKLGRPSLDPVVFFKCLLVGFFENIVHDTDLEFRLADSMVLRWFIGYGLDERTPDESTLRKTRERMPDEVFRLVFAYVLRVCSEHGLVKGRALGTDATLVDANASLDSLVHRELGCSYEEYVLALRRQDQPEAGRAEAKAADRQRAGKASNRDWVSPTDPDAKVAVHADKHTALSFRPDVTVDLETGVIVSAGVQLADQSDQETCLQRVDEATENLAELGLTPLVVVADKGHHCGENLAGIEERGLLPLVTAPAAGGPAGFRRQDFEYDATTDTYRCPAGQELRYTGDGKDGRRYRLKGSICRHCPHFGVCTKDRRGRQLQVGPHEASVVANRERMRSEEFRPLRMIRRQRGEAPFGYFKQYGGLRRFAGRGIEYATKKALVAALGWNLLLLVKKMMRAAESDLQRTCRTVLTGVSALWRVLAGRRDAGRTVRPTTTQRAWRRVAEGCSQPKRALSGGC